MFFSFVEILDNGDYGETKFIAHQWQAAANTAHNFDLCVWQNHWVKKVHLNLNSNYQQVLDVLQY